jgi:hypothetical protein
MGYSKANLKSGGDRASHCFKPFWIGKLLDKYLPVGLTSTNFVQPD